jgi:very-short-patch-repair endonuclease
MKQPIKKNKNIEEVRKKPLMKKTKTVKKHPQYGTSKLEEDFAHNFLDKLGVKYTYQFEAKDIGRFFDFYLQDENLIIEVDGDFWHGNPEKYDKDELRGHQKRAQRVDEHKTKWALLHSIPILRFWESDIRKNPKKVMKILKEELGKRNRQIMLENNKKKRH